MRRIVFGLLLPLMNADARRWDESIATSALIGVDLWLNNYALRRALGLVIASAAADSRIGNRVRTVPS